ncbi:MAG: hypothetical protein IJ960_08035 [Oscillospiraceae bacterium]|nr:hypothetical protein [Oscillospiraceae bacterium]
MKRWLALLLALLLLTGCGRVGETTPTTIPTVPVETTVPPETTLPPETEPPVPELLTRGTPWGDGTLLELPMPIETQDTEVTFSAFGEKLLLIQRHYDLEGHGGMTALSLCLLDPDTLEVQAEQTVSLEVTDWLEPQIQSDRICICENSQGVVTILDENLNQTARWETGTGWNETLTMGHGDLVYINRDSSLWERNLATGEERCVWEGGSALYTNGTYPHGMSLGWYIHENRRWEVGFLNFESGELEPQPFRGHFDFSERHGDQWLCRRFSDGRNVRLGNGDRAWDFFVEDGTMYLTAERFLMNDRGGVLSMYDLEGRRLSTCNISFDGWYYCEKRPVWREELNGWLLLVINTETGTPHLLYWPMGIGEGENLALTEVDLTITAEQEMAMLADRAETIGTHYGLEILVGNACDTEFVDFTAQLQTDPEVVKEQLDILEQVLGSFPEGFVQQLCTYDFSKIQIHLIRNLMAKPEFGTGGAYGGFVFQDYGPETATYIMAVDTNTEREATYYHEFNHIIEDQVWRASIAREDALYSWDGWMERNPEGFEYTYDKANYIDLAPEWEPYFIDNYALINDLEDRSRLFEYACTGNYDWIWADKPGALEKLRYYADCIRDSFNTEGWPQVTVWERVLQ